MAKIVSRTRTNKVVKNKSGKTTTYSKVGKSWKVTGGAGLNNPRRKK